jgi:glycosyltransferase involved in cell wall biosynthesis
VTHPNQITSFQNPDDTAEFIERGIVSESETVVTPGSGVDPERFPYVNGTSTDTENPIVMLPTRLLWHKGVVVFVEAAQQLQASDTDAQFVVGDTDPEKPASVPQRQMREWDEAGIIDWWDQEADVMPETLQRADIVCLPPYYREGAQKSSSRRPLPDVPS